MPADQSNGSGRSPWSLSMWERLSQTFLKPAAPKTEVVEPEVDVTRLSDEEKRALITRIDPLERKIGLAASAFAAVLAVLINVTYMLGHFAVPIAGVTPKNGHCAGGFKYVKAGNTCNGVYPPNHYILPLVLGLVFALAIFVTVRIGRRAPLAFAIALTGVALGSLIEIIPFILVAAWLILRSYRVQKYGSPKAKAPLPGWVPPPRGQGRSRTKPSSSTATKTKSAAASTQAGSRKPPPANKRYTPKAPPKKRAAPPAPARPSNRQAKSKSGPASKSDTKGT